MHRIFVNQAAILDRFIQLDTSTHHHLFNVCRLKHNDEIEIVVDESILWRVKIDAVTNEGCYFFVTDKQSISRQRHIPIELIQSLPNQDKLTEIAKLCCSSGVSSITPVISDFCSNRRLPEHKVQRIQTAILSAAQQSKQVEICALRPIQPLGDYLNTASFLPSALKLVAYEHSSEEISIPYSPTSIHIAIGPEGGYSTTDIALFTQHGFIPFTLGSSILRTEHAGFAAVYFLDGFLKKNH
jgi:16S rRNA (uracil1498-N3)-methyltransferase